MAKAKKRPERVKGGYLALPWSVMDSLSFTGCTDKAKSILLAFGRQLSGENNGHLQASKSWLNKQGYTCPASNKKAIVELVERGLLVKMKQGGLNMGCDLYAVTWLPISDRRNLDPDFLQYFVQGAYQLCNLPRTKRRPQPKKSQFNG